VRWDLVRDRVRAEYLREHKQGFGGLLLGATTEVTLDTPLVRRAAVRVELTDVEGAVQLSAHGRTTRWPAHARPALEAVLGRDRFTLRTLGDALDERGWLTLARKLLGEAVLTFDATRP
jgi:hypothetical protein